MDPDSRGPHAPSGRDTSDVAKIHRSISGHAQGAVALYVFSE